MKGEFYVEFPQGIGKNGTVTYKIMYQADPDATPAVAQEQVLDPRSLCQNNIERV